MFKRKLVGILALALVGSTGLAYGQNGKPSTSTPTQVEVVNKTVLVGTATLHMTQGQPVAPQTPPFDVSPYSVVRLALTRVCTGGTPVIYVDNTVTLDTVSMNTATTQRVYDIPGETLTVIGAGISSSEPDNICDLTITIWGRRN